MSKVNIKLTYRQVVGSTSNEHQYYGSVQSKGCINLDQIAEEIEAMCTVTLTDIKGVLAAFQEQCLVLLRNGDGISFAELGTMYVHANSRCKNHPWELSIDDVKKIYPYFKASRQLRKKLAKEKLSFNIVRD